MSLVLVVYEDGKLPGIVGKGPEGIFSELLWLKLLFCAMGGDHWDGPGEAVSVMGHSVRQESQDNFIQNA